MQSILDAIENWIKEILIGAIESSLSSMFGDVNEKVGTIAAEVGRSPQAWNNNIFSMIETLAGTVITPIAAIIITYVLLRGANRHGTGQKFHARRRHVYVFQVFLQGGGGGAYRHPHL